MKGKSTSNAKLSLRTIAKMVIIPQKKRKADLWTKIERHKPEDVWNPKTSSSARAKFRTAAQVIGSHRHRNAANLSTLTKSYKEGAKYTGVWEAAFAGDVHALRIFIEDHKSDPNGADRTHGMTPLHYSAKGGWGTCTRFLLQQKGIKVHSLDNMGFTALQIARRRGHSEVEDILLEHIERDSKPFY